MKKVFYGLGVYYFCVSIYEIINAVVSRLKKNQKNTRRVKGSYDRTDDIYAEKGASCPLDRIGF